MSDRTRISVFYGGTEYAIAGRSLDDVTADIEAGLAADGPSWLDVNTGQGRSTAARILLGRGMPIAIWEVNTDGEDSPREDADGLSAIVDG